VNSRGAPVAAKNRAAAAVAARARRRAAPLSQRQRFVQPHRSTASAISSTCGAKAYRRRWIARPTWRSSQRRRISSTNGWQPKSKWPMRSPRCFPRSDAGPPHLVSSRIGCSRKRHGALRRTRGGSHVMTLHSAKGLEFRVVFMVGMEEGLLPHGRALWGETAGRRRARGERRLCYVRADARRANRLLLTYAAQRTLHGPHASEHPIASSQEMPARLLERGGLARPPSRTPGDRHRFGRACLPTRGRQGRRRQQHLRPESKCPPSTPLAIACATPLWRRIGGGCSANRRSRRVVEHWPFLDRAVGIKKLVLSYTALERSVEVRPRSAEQL